MTDRELLEAAAKAAGKPIRWDGHVCVLTDPDWKSDKCSAWNPLADDGDALRLAVKLQLRVENYGDVVQVAPSMRSGEMIELFTGLSGADPYAATRRAIVRAAAALASTEQP